MDFLFTVHVRKKEGTVKKSYVIASQGVIYKGRFYPFVNYT